MKELRPLGSEKLTGDEKIKRILEIANYGRTAKPSVSVDKPEYVTESKIGGVYGIVKEKDGFYVKKGLTENSLEYIGGMFMKNKNKFSSYGEAYKRLDYLIGQEILQEATKYVLKQTKTPDIPPMEAAPAEPSMDKMPPAPEGKMPPMGDEMSPAPEGEMSPMGTENEPSAEGDKNQLRSSYMAEIQKFAGKLGQELRDQKDKLESDDIKYTLNMIISAVDLDQLDDKDFEEIADKFDPEKREGGENSEIPPTGDETVPEPEAEPAPEEEMAEENDAIFNEFEDDDAMSKLDEFINNPIDDEDSTDHMLRQYSDIGDDEDYEQSSREMEYGIHPYDDEDEYKDDEIDLKEFDDESDVESDIINWEEKLRGKSKNEPKQRPQLDIDEISRAISNALSKYR